MSNDNADTTPLSADEFADLMARECGMAAPSPGPDSGVAAALAVGVSGGPDSLALACLLVASVWAVVIGLVLVCAGFFTVHAAAVGAINRKLSGGQGRANALYVLFYYVGGWIGITVAGLAYTHLGWVAVVGLAFVLLLLLVNAGLSERRRALP